MTALTVAGLRGRWDPSRVGGSLSLAIGDEARETLRLAAGDSVDKLTLDIVVVVVAEEVATEVGVLEGMLMSRMATRTRFELVEFVGGVRWVVEESPQFEGSQSGRG
jgi:hypothetical protein